jgi:hypothetical protein
MYHFLLISFPDVKMTKLTEKKFCNRRKSKLSLFSEKPFLFRARSKTLKCEDDDDVYFVIDV